MASLSNVIDVMWLVIAGLLAFVVVIAFPLSNRVKDLFRRYGSSVLPNVTDLVSVNTPATNFQLQKYFLTKAYEKETEPELRSIGKTVRIISIAGLVLTALGFILTGLAIWVSLH